MADQGVLRFTIAERGKGAHISIPTEGTTVEVPDYDAVNTALLQIRDGKNPNNWCLLGYEGDSTDTVVLLGEGAGGINEMHTHLKDDNAAYGFVRFTDMLDERPVIRYAFIVWMGDGVPAMKKARIATNKSAIVELIGTYSVEVLADRHEDITEKEIMDKIQDTSGSKHREVNTWDVDPAKLKREPVAPSKPRSVVPTQKQSLDFPNLDELKAALSNIRNDAEPLTWCLCAYNHRSNAVELVSSGNGDLEEVKSALQPDKAMFGFFRVSHTVDQSETIKFVFISYVGESVSPLQRGKIPTLRGSVVSVFEPYHIEIQFSDLDDFTIDDINKRIEHARGL